MTNTYDLVCVNYRTFTDPDSLTMQRLLEDGRDSVMRLETRDG